MYLGYGQLLVLDESLTVLLVLVYIIETALCVIALSEINDDDRGLHGDRHEFLRLVFIGLGLYSCLPISL